MCGKDYSKYVGHLLNDIYHAYTAVKIWEHLDLRSGKRY